MKHGVAAGIHHQDAADAWCRVSGIFKSYDEPRQFGLRVNTLKISPQEFGNHCPISNHAGCLGAKWVLLPEEDMPSRHPFYFAGLYYLQEPSAMTPASRLPVEKGDRVLDLCAAPGERPPSWGH